MTSTTTTTVSFDQQPQQAYEAFKQHPNYPFVDSKEVAWPASPTRKPQRELVFDYSPSPVLSSNATLQQQAYGKLKGISKQLFANDSSLESPFLLNLNDYPTSIVLVLCTCMCLFILFFANYLLVVE